MPDDGGSRLAQKSGWRVILAEFYGKSAEVGLKDSGNFDTVKIDGKHDLLIDAFVEHSDCHIFNTPSFFKLHSAGRKGHYFQLVERGSRIPRATIHFTETAPGHYRSPARGTFGGVSAGPGLEPEHLESFLSAVEAELRARCAGSFEILLQPAGYDPAGASSTRDMLVRLGYVVSAQELNHDLVVDERPLSVRMEHGNRKRLNKCAREGFSSARLGQSRYREAYDLIAANRKRRGFPITMSYPEIERMVELFGDRLRFFGVTHEDKLAAASVCIVVSRDVLYVFYWGDADGLREFSPVVPLAATIYGHCQQEGFRVLDAGISTAGGVPNLGLIRFKHSLSFQESPKLTLTKLAHA